VMFHSQFVILNATTEIILDLNFTIKSQYYIISKYNNNNTKFFQSKNLEFHVKC
jgi:hypothetical protein